MGFGVQASYDFMLPGVYRGKSSFCENTKMPITQVMKHSPRTFNLAVQLL